jgi:regulator of protease activity HflC (stomatin/prohibitin superfamily)
MGGFVGVILALGLVTWGIATSITSSSGKGGGGQRVRLPRAQVHNPGRLVGCILGAVAIAPVCAWSVIVIPGAHVACVYDPLRGGIQDYTLPEGLRTIAPWVQTEVFSVQTQEYTMSISPKEGAIIGDDSIRCETNEGLKVLLDLTVLFHIDPQRAPMLWRKLGSDYARIFVRPIVRERIRMVVAKYSVQDVYSGRRDQIAQEISRELQDPFQQEGLVLEQILLRNVAYGHADFAKAIAQKQSRQQDVTTEKRRLEQAQFDKQATVNKAQGEAQSITLRAQTLARNPQVVRYDMVQKLAPRVRRAYMSEGSLPLPLGGAGQ